MFSNVRQYAENDLEKAFEPLGDEHEEILLGIIEKYIQAQGLWIFSWIPVRFQRRLGVREKTVVWENSAQLLVEFYIENEQKHVRIFDPRYGRIDTAYLIRLAEQLRIHFPTFVILVEGEYKTF